MGRERWTRRDFFLGLGGGALLLAVDQALDGCSPTPDSSEPNKDQPSAEGLLGYTIRGKNDDVNKLLSYQLKPPTDYRLKNPNGYKLKPPTAAALPEQAIIRSSGNVVELGHNAYNVYVSVSDGRGGTVKTYLPDKNVREALLLYANAGDIFSQDNIVYAFSIGTTEAGTNFNYVASVSNGVRTTFDNCPYSNTSKTSEFGALQRIAQWVGQDSSGVNNLIVEHNKLTGQQATTLGQLGCSVSGAMGTSQFLPSTWEGDINTMTSRLGSQMPVFLDRFKKIGLVRAEVSQLSQLNPFIFSEALIMTLVKMQIDGIRVDGTNFGSWNADGGQASLVKLRFSELLGQFKQIISAQGSPQAATVQAPAETIPVVRTETGKNIGWEIASRAPSIIGKYPYGAGSAEQNPGTGYFVCTDLFIVLCTWAKVPIAKDAFKHNSLRWVPFMQQYFKGTNFGDTVNQPRAWHEINAKPQVGWAIFWLEAHVGVIYSVTDNGDNTLTVQTVEAKGFSRTDPKQNIMSEKYICRKTSDGWRMDPDASGRAVSGFGEILNS